MSRPKYRTILALPYYGVAEEKGVDGRGNVTWYARVVDLPVPPVVGMGVMVHDGSDPVDVKQVYVNMSGEVVAVLPADDIDKYDDLTTRRDIASMSAYLTSGFSYVGEDMCGYHKLTRGPVAGSDGYGIAGG